MQYLCAVILVIILIELLIIAFNTDILVKKLAIIEDLLDRIAEALEHIIEPDDGD